MEQNKVIQEEVTQQIENHYGQVSIKMLIFTNTFRPSTVSEKIIKYGMKNKSKDGLTTHSMHSQEVMYLLHSQTMIVELNNIEILIIIPIHQVKNFVIFFTLVTVSQLLVIILSKFIWIMEKLRFLLLPLLNKKNLLKLINSFSDIKNSICLLKIVFFEIILTYLRKLSLIINSITFKYGK